MGGFTFGYVDSTEQLVDDGTADDYRPIRFQRIDDDRQLLLYWVDRDGSSAVGAVVVDASTAPALTVGAVTTFDTLGLPFAEVVDLGGGDWLMHSGGWEEACVYERFTISGITITRVDTAPVSVRSGWSYSDPAVPVGIFEGHPGTGGFPPTTYTVIGNGTWAGIDSNNVLVGAELRWWDGTVNQYERKLAVLDLTTAAVTASFDAAALGFWPDVDSTAASDTLSQGLAAQVEPGIAYWWGFSANDLSTPALIYLTYGTGSASGTVIASGSTVPWGQRAGPALDGTYWLPPSSETHIAAHTWTMVEQWDDTYAAYSMAAGVVTTHTYTNEVEPLGSAVIGPPVAAGADLMAMMFESFRTDDTHMRAERLVGGRFPETVYPPDYNTVGGGGIVGATPVDGYILFAWRDNGTADLFLAVMQEVPVRPEASFFSDFAWGTVPAVPDTLNFDATDSVFNTGDSYWHPITDYYWQWDDGTSDHLTVPTTSHTFTRGSTGHFGGDDWSPFPADPFSLAGYTNEDSTVPILVVGNSVGLSDPYTEGPYQFAGRPPQRQYPRDDGLGISTRRSWPPPTSKQDGSRRGPTATYW